VICGCARCAVVAAESELADCWIHRRWFVQIDAVLRVGLACGEINSSFNRVSRAPTVLGR